MPVSMLPQPAVDDGRLAELDQLIATGAMPQPAARIVTTYDLKQVHSVLKRRSTPPRDPQAEADRRAEKRLSVTAGREEKGRVRSAIRDVEERNRGKVPEPEVQPSIEGRVLKLALEVYDFAGDDPAAKVAEFEAAVCELKAARLAESIMAEHNPWPAVRELALRCVRAEAELRDGGKA